MMKTFCSASYFFIAILFLFVTAVLPGAADDLVTAGDRVVFIGDSNTYAGKYVSDIDAITRSNGLVLDIINVGLPSENCSGLSEPDHPFPRPTVHERLERVLLKTKPDVVVVCYGMNDGIYHPFSEDRFKKYQQGMKQVIEKVKASDARLLLLTPPPFDALPMKKKGKLVDKNAKLFGWRQVYEDYDQVLKQYSKWILTLKPEVDSVIDIRTPIVNFLKEKRKQDPDYTMSGDGIHFNATSHRIIAKAIAAKILTNPELEVNTEVATKTHAKMILLRDAWLTETKHVRPGVKKGLPIEEAIQQVRKLDKEINNLLKAD